MSIFRIGSGFKGTSQIETSIANQELISTLKPDGWTLFQMYSMTFKNYTPCTVKINGGDPIFLDKGDGFVTSHVDTPIYSFVIVEAGVQYTFVGGY